MIDKSKQRRSKWFERRRGHLFLVMALFVIFSLGFSPSVSAQEEGNHLQRAQNGTDLYTTGCAGEGTSYGVVAMAYLQYAGYQFGYVQLWRSDTCQTFWARYICLLQPEKCSEVHYRLESLNGLITLLDDRWDTGGRTFQFGSKNPVSASVSLYGSLSFGASTGWVSTNP